MDYLSGLNEKQKEAVLSKDGALLIVAGAGAGKTKTLTHRIAHLIKEGVAPTEILAVTFTNKAAKEMNERVAALIDLPLSFSGRPNISTFHSLGVRIIKENAARLGLNRFFPILDEDDSISLIKESMKELGIDPKENAPRGVRSFISRSKNEYLTIDDFSSANAESYKQALNLAVWKKYEEKKKKEGSLDFDDLLLETARLLDRDAEVLKSYHDRWKFIHIDEYQDTNKVQYLISRLLSRGSGNICVVGDGDQNIYSWRGADIGNILSFEEDYPDAKVILLEENYRSTKNILEAANEVIKKNRRRKEKNLFTNGAEGEPISIFEAYSEKFEAEFVAEKALELIDHGVSPDDIAVLYRANFQSRILEEYMLRYSIPYQVLGVKFFDRKEVKDMLSYLRAAMNKESAADVKRAIMYPRRGLGKVALAKVLSGKMGELPPKMRAAAENFFGALAKIKVFAENHLPSETIKFILKTSGIEKELQSSKLEEDLERLENLRELATFAGKYDSFPPLEGIEKLLEEASLASEQDSLSLEEKKKKKGVKLMTVHASKGLEFKHVFIVGLEAGLFPHERDFDTEADTEEERRLFYVALTRAKEKLFLSYATLRTIFGESRLQAPSEFLRDIPPEITYREERESSGLGDNVIYLD